MHHINCLVKTSHFRCFGHPRERWLILSFHASAGDNRLMASYLEKVYDHWLQWWGPREINFSSVTWMILLVTRSDIELIVVSLNLHLADNIRLDRNVQCQILLTGNLCLGTPQWLYGELLRTPWNLRPLLLDSFFLRPFHRCQTRGLWSRGYRHLLLLTVLLPFTDIFQKKLATHL